MRRQQKWSFFCSMITLAAIIVSLAVPVIAAEEKIVSEDSLKVFPQGYEYPILPGTDQWLQFHDFPSKIEACQIPEDILKAMSTAQVLESALNYPLNVNAFVWNTPEAGYHSVLSYSNVHQELMSRADAAEALIARYGATPATMAEANEDEQWDRAQQIWLMEIMLQQPSIQQQMDEDQQSVVERYAVEKLEQERGNLFYGEDPTSYYYSVPIQRDLPQHRETYTTITSPHGARIAVIIRGEELSSAQKENMRKKMKDEFPYANVLSEETTNYNCHSYAYYSQNTRTNKYWINDPRNYFGIDFLQRASGTQIQVNDRIFYWKGSNISSAGLDSLHSGIATNHGTMIKSKWGPYALYEHAYNDCPYYTGANITWYRPA